MLILSSQNGVSTQYHSSANAKGDNIWLIYVLGTEMLMGSLKMSALHLAAREGNVECVSLLLGAGADPRSR